MIVIDTHIWIWWVHGNKQLTKTQATAIKAHETDVIGVSAISCWEIAKLVEKNKIKLPSSLSDWFKLALTYPGIRLLGGDHRFAHKKIFGVL